MEYTLAAAMCLRKPLCSVEIAVRKADASSVESMLYVFKLVSLPNKFTAFLDTNQFI